MSSILTPFLIFCLLGSLLLPSLAQSTCSSQTIQSNKVFSSCNDLPRLSAYLHWTYHPSNGTVDIAYIADASTGWIAWAINPYRTTMVGSQALVAYKQSNGTIRSYTTQIQSYTPDMAPAALNFTVTDLSAVSSGTQITIFATVTLLNNGTTVNQVWQTGPVSGTTLQSHVTSGANILAMGTVDFLSGTTTSTGSNSKTRRRNVHGVLNAVSWGILMPIGAIIARYMKVFKSADPAWFYLHVACQSSAYIIGVAGWGTGLKLGSDSPGVKYNTHRNIGITLFCFGTLQVFALLLRPKKDHKYRLYWNVYHHSIGYTTIILSIVNIFKGFDILDPEKKWKNTYIGIIVALAAIAVVLEAVTWPIVLKRRSSSPEKSHHGTNGVNAYAGRQQQVV